MASRFQRDLAPRLQRGCPRPSTCGLRLPKRDGQGSTEELGLRPRTWLQRSFGGCAGRRQTPAGRKRRRRRHGHGDPAGGGGRRGGHIGGIGRGSEQPLHRNCHLRASRNCHLRASQQGKVKVDWSKSPFVVSYRGYTADACVPTGGDVGTPLSCLAGTDRWMNRQLDAAEWGTVAWAKKNYMHYNYCDDGWRFPQGFPAECSRN
ncbi:hypothetical protein BDA96_03G297300 [Sorghum bicolor]|uniref:Xyloglucan endo-transglycosylase C-terminal domain-containing protein n=1 Tax=Sorghum bicolor TaxID=4558 RepID=A0A921RF21_SORBI|nr:hypothetical protein BDA96_03G297300 [Sorghum bicolor]